MLGGCCGIQIQGPQGAQGAQGPQGDAGVIPVFQDIDEVNAQPSLDDPLIIMLDMPDTPGNEGLYRVAASGAAADDAQVIDTVFGASKQLIRVGTAPGFATNPMVSATGMVATVTPGTLVPITSATFSVNAGLTTGHLGSTNAAGQIVGMRRKLASGQVWIRASGSAVALKTIAMGFIVNGAPSDQIMVFRTASNLWSCAFSQWLGIGDGDTLEIGIANASDTTLLTVTQAAITYRLGDLLF